MYIEYNATGRIDGIFLEYYTTYMRVILSYVFLLLLLLKIDY